MGEERQKVEKNKRKRMLRLNILFCIVFCLFTILIVRLGIVQIVSGESYSAEVSRQDAKIVNLFAPRGKMFERHGNVLVDNEGINAVVFTVESGMKSSEKILIAKKLAKILDVDTKEFRERDLKDYWLAAYPDEARKLIKEKELKLKPKDTYQLQLERIPGRALKEIEQNELEEAVLYQRMTSGYMYEPQIIKAEDLTMDEMSKVAENLASLPGVQIMTDWKRKYPYGELLRPILGSVTSAKQGILEERSSYYLSRGYSRNDRVGKSYLEYQYEEVLHPQKPKKKITTDRFGNTIDEEIISEGSRGYDLHLTINAKLQQEVEKIIEEELMVAKGKGNPLLDRAFVVMMDPYSGEIFSIAGRQMDSKRRNEFLDYSVGTFTEQYEIGSTIKGATLLAGYQTGAIGHNTSFFDEPIYLAEAEPKASVRNHGLINDIQALKVSSNVYMFYTAMKIAGVNYVPHGGLSVQDEDFLKLRNVYRQFGLGVPTGIDLPNESNGFQGDPAYPGLLLDMTIGQFDTYTPLQMAQYVSVIANGGLRVRPHLVSGIHTPTLETKLGPVVQAIQPELLNKVNNTKEDIDRIREGFRQVVQELGGTAYSSFTNDVAGKTGTAQTTYYGPDKSNWGEATYNLTFVGYYPSENPQMAFSVVVPWASNDRHSLNKLIANRVVEAFVKYESNYGISTNAEERNQQ